MISYIYLVCVNYDGKYMYKIGRCSQDPYNHIKRLKAYPKNSKICFVFIVPNARVEAIESEIINMLYTRFTCAQGKEYFEGDEKELLKVLSSKMTELYSEQQVMCDVCKIDKNKKPLLHQRDKYECLLSEEDKEEIKQNLSTGKTEPVIDLDNVAKWLQVKKTILYKTLQQSYKEDTDYIVEKRKRIIKEGDDKRGGHLYKFILLTVNCFKKLCMRSRSEKAEQVRTYFIELDDFVKRYTKTR